MALFPTPAEHTANPPATWTVEKAADRVWLLKDARGNTITSCATKKAATEAAQTGFFVNLYDKETRWYAGETITGWRPYADTLTGN